MFGSILIIVKEDDNILNVYTTRFYVIDPQYDHYLVVSTLELVKENHRDIELNEYF